MTGFGAPCWAVPFPLERLLSRSGCFGLHGCVILLCRSVTYRQIVQLPFECGVIVKHLLQYLNPPLRLNVKFGCVFIFYCFGYDIKVGQRVSTLPYMFY